MYTFTTIIFWILSLTWGSIMTTFGITLGLFMLITGHTPKIFAKRYIYFQFKTLNGFGFEAGPIFFIGSDCDFLSLKQHEAGHGIQNVLFGPFMPILVSIPSAIRYWYRYYIGTRHPEKRLPSYDSIWFEGWATKLGEKYYHFG